MVIENSVDLTGFVYNIILNEDEKGNSSRISFLLSVKNRYKSKKSKNNDFVHISCTVFGYKDNNGKNNKSFEYLDKNLCEGQLIRVQGRLNSWSEALVNGELVPLNQENRNQATKIITRNNLIVADYAMLETKEETLKRLKSKKQSSAIEEEKETPISDKQEEPNKLSEQENFFYPLDADDSFPVYRNFVS